MTMEATPVDSVSNLPAAIIVNGVTVPFELVTWPVPGGNVVVVPPGVGGTLTEDGFIGGVAVDGDDTDEGDVVVAITVNVYVLPLLSPVIKQEVTPATEHEAPPEEVTV
jgi:hypothetical protein